MQILNVTGLKKVYTTRFGGSQVTALRQVDFSVEEGEYVAIMGESGSGKTTLLNILAALDKPTAGRVELDGRDMSAVRESDAAAFRRDNLGFVFQEFNLLDTFTLRDNIYLPLVLAGRPYRELKARLDPIARQLGILELLDISWVYQRDPEEITVQATRENKPDILQYRIEVPADKKVDAIASIIRAQQLDRVICFCNTKGSTERLTKFLQLRGLDAQCIHGDIPQRKREEVMARFRDGQLHVFVATDVASRGIDVDDVDAVFNFDVPEENEYYIHRIGRTGRAKKHGVAYTLLSDFPSRMRLDDIARNTRSQIIPATLEEDGRVTPATR